MIDTWLARLREPRFGIVLFSAFTALLMAIHWTPMAIPGLVVTALSLMRPRMAVRPVVWWVMAGLWFAALVVVQERMEDHVYLFAVWLVALAISLARRDDEDLVAQAAWHARVLIGVAFTAAVAWKLYFGEFVTGVTLWLLIVVDGRFQPLATLVGLSDTAIERDRERLAELLAGTVETMSVEPSAALWRITAVAIFALVLEAVIAASHLVSDSNNLATLRVPSIVLFAVMTYAVVPVVPFAVLLAVLAMAAARWRDRVLWIFPVMVIVPVIRLLLIN